MQKLEKIEELTENLKVYLNTNCELIKLQATERSSMVGAGLISKVLVGIIGLLFLLFTSLTLSFYLSQVFGNSYSGFAIVACFYFILGFVLVIARKKLIERPIRDKIILSILSKN